MRVPGKPRSTPRIRPKGRLAFLQAETPLGPGRVCLRPQHREAAPKFDPLRRLAISAVADVLRKLVENLIARRFRVSADAIDCSSELCKRMDISIGPVDPPSCFDRNFGPLRERDD